MAERASLKRQNTLVNRRAALATLFLLAACGGQEENVGEVRSSSVTAPIVWQTPVFGNDIAGFSLSDAAPMQILIANEESGIQLIDVDGATIGRPGPYTASDISEAVLGSFGETQLRLFPGIDRNSGRLSLFAHGDGLVAPIDIDVENAPSDYLEGLCSGRPASDDGLMQIGFWTQLDKATLVIGELTNVAGALTFEETERLEFDKYLTSCAIDGDTIVAGGGFGLAFGAVSDDNPSLDVPGVPVELTVREFGDTALAALTMSGGQVYLAYPDGKIAAVQFRAGLSSASPQAVGDIAMTTLGSVGSFPNGFLAVESQTSQGSQLVYADLRELMAQFQESE